MRRTHFERGEVSEFVILTVIALVLVVGLVVDGGAKLTAASEASSIASEAGRAGGQPLTALPTEDGVAINQSRSATAAQEYISAAGAHGSVTQIDPTTLEVTVTVDKETVFLGLIGIHSVSATRTARVDLIRGQTEVIPQ